MAGSQQSEAPIVASSFTPARAAGLAVVLVAVFTYAAYEAQGYPGQAAYFPKFVAYGGMLFALLWLVRELVRLRRTGLAESVTSDRTASLAARARAAFDGTGVLLLYLAAVLLLGYWAASVVIVPVYLVVRARAPIVMSIVVPLAIFAGIWVLGNVLNFRWPLGVFA